MTNAFPTGFGGGSDKFVAGIGQNLWDAMEQLREGFEKKASPRVSRGDVRAAVLSLLAESPMHGYQIIQEIAERSGGSWKPSAGSVYPTLPLLSDEGLITAEESDGRKTYALTDAGRAEADEAAQKPSPWQSTASRASEKAELPKAGMELAQVVAHVARTGTPEQTHEAAELLDDVRRKLYAILARA